MPTAVASSVVLLGALGWLHVLFHISSHPHSLVGSPQVNDCHSWLLYRLHSHMGRPASPIHRTELRN
jgi:hypothetical protein